ncbi:MAG TPA: class I SAM-dependent methyltransferase [Candidatus Solibacter sp.]|nr:class I SAM-dependent methyltransferase [Candidatus Solibacter sp.]
MIGAFLRRCLAHPLTSALAVDDPATTELRNQIIASKPFLRSIYDDWYRMLSNELPAGDGPVLELGSGAGYCEQFIPGLITSEIFHCSRARVVADAQQIPFADGSLRAIIMTDVLHHMPNVESFFREASRCLRQGGKIIMIEPWVTPWSRFVYTRLHHEPFLAEAKDWSFSSSGPLSGSNSALPWILFLRDRQKFESLFPELTIERIRPFMPFRYLISGGVGLRSLMPGLTYHLWARLECMLEPAMARLAMFVFVSLRRS